MNLPRQTPPGLPPAWVEQMSLVRKRLVELRQSAAEARFDLADDYCREIATTLRSSPVVKMMARSWWWPIWKLRLRLQWAQKRLKKA
jgi:hypothetical protein